MPSAFNANVMVCHLPQYSCPHGSPNGLRSFDLVPRAFGSGDLGQLCSAPEHPAALTSGRPFCAGQRSWENTRTGAEPSPPGFADLRASRISRPAALRARRSLVHPRPPQPAQRRGGLHAVSRGARAHTLARPETELVLENACAQVFDDGGIRLWLLEGEEGAIGASLFGAGGGESCFLVTAYDRAWSAYGPGIATVIAGIEDAFTRATGWSISVTDRLSTSGPWRTLRDRSPGIACFRAAGLIHSPGRSGRRDTPPNAYRGYASACAPVSAWPRCGLASRQAGPNHSQGSRP